MFNHWLESSHLDDSNEWSNIGFGEEITQVESIEVHFTHLTQLCCINMLSTDISRNHFLFSRNEIDYDVGCFNIVIFNLLKRNVTMNSMKRVI